MKRVMKKHTINNVRLGIFVLGGLLFVVMLLYMIGRNRNLFGSSFILKAHFENVQGLVSGNNVRYVGIQVGTVRRLVILNDTTVEVVMVIDDDMRNYIRKNAIASIGTDGLMGNKVINIMSADPDAQLVTEGTILSTKKALDTEEMLRTLNKTNEDVSVIAAQLKTTVERLNNSNAIWSMLSDQAIPQHIRKSAANVQLATTRAALITGEIQALIAGVQNGEGTLGKIIKDTTLSKDLLSAIHQISSTAADAEQLVDSVRLAVAALNEDLNTGDGTINTLLKDSLMARRLSKSMANIENGTENFNLNMEALKSSFLFRGYFRKMEKQKLSQKNGQVVSQ